MPNGPSPLPPLQTSAKRRNSACATGRPARSTAAATGIAPSVARAKRPHQTALRRGTRPEGSPTRFRGTAQGRPPPTEHSGAARHAPVSLPTRNRPPDGDQPQSLNSTPTTLITNRKGATQAPFPILKPGTGMFRSRWSALPLLRAPRSARSQPPAHRPPGAIAGLGRRPPERR